jgi:RimJ/RimL family protein N-acetyltransferase
VSFAQGKFLTAEVGFATGSACWGQEIMTEAFGVALNYLCHHMGYHRIEASHDIENTASDRVIEKCGMRYEDTKRQGMLRKDGTYGRYAYVYCIGARSSPIKEKKPRTKMSAAFSFII